MIHLERLNFCRGNTLVGRKVNGSYAMSVSTGSKGVGSKDLCKTNETQRAHGQCQSFVVEQRWHPGMCFNLRPRHLTDSRNVISPLQCNYLMSDIRYLGVKGADG